MNDIELPAMFCRVPCAILAYIEISVGKFGKQFRQLTWAQIDHNVDVLRKAIFTIQATGLRSGDSVSELFSFHRIRNEFEQIILIQASSDSSPF